MVIVLEGESALGSLEVVDNVSPSLIFDNSGGGVEVALGRGVGSGRIAVVLGSVDESEGEGALEESDGADGSLILAGCLDGSSVFEGAVVSVNLDISGGEVLEVEVSTVLESGSEGAVPVGFGTGIGSGLEGAV